MSDIAHIYCYLGVSESFCRAVIGESRSFSPELFTQAACVLRKIGKSEEFLKRFEELAEKITVCKVFHYTCIIHSIFFNFIDCFFVMHAYV